MKKLFALLMAATMTLSLCACGGSEEVDIKEAVIGTWEYKYQLTEYRPTRGQKGDVYREVIEIYKGGTGKYSAHNDSDSNVPAAGQSLTWEITDDVLNVTYGSGIFSSVEGFVYDATDDTLTTVDNTETYARAD